MHVGKRFRRIDILELRAEFLHRTLRSGWELWRVGFADAHREAVWRVCGLIIPRDDLDTWTR